MTPIVLMIGLSTHSIFEGIACGLESDLNNVILMVVAIILHKGAAGLSLGISMAKAFPNRDKFIMILLFLFSIATPLGVIIGWAVAADSPMSEIVFGCLAAGTFLYIACSEVIIEEFSMPDQKYLKLFVFLIGIGIISSLKALDPGDDDGDDGSSR